MSNKEILGRIGFVIITFIFVVFLINAQDTGFWVTLPTVTPNLANKKSLELLWTTLVTATIIQGLVLYAAILGSNLQFTPMTKKKINEDER
jgi:hypothetical protein